MPRTKRQCNKYATDVCVWGWGEHFLYIVFGQWHFVIGILSRRDHKGLNIILTLMLKGKVEST